MNGNRIKERRTALKMTQGELGEAVGVGKSTVSEWEHNKRSPSIDAMQAIAAALQTTTAHLAGWDEPQKQESPKLAILFKRSRALNEKQLDIVMSIVDEMAQEHE